MHILALETTQRLASLAAMDGGNLLAQLTLEPDKRSAQSLAPGVKHLLGQVGWKMADVRLIGVSIGPGSFTGLRIGVTTAKTLAYAAGADILGVDTLEAIAAAAAEGIDAVWTGVDAQRGQAVVGSFRRNRQGWFEPAAPQRLVDLAEWAAALPAGSVLSGPFLERLTQGLPAGVQALPKELWPPTAAHVGRLAWRHHAAGRRDNPWSLVPRYSRRSAAEEKRDGPVADKE
ncbi:MAG: tRNA (adenosine(37)-N6)-threonylcarbamoyltransferase complex dimerization subunit type 1 TsaB [Pirellulales bacterium]|nr:tRNA (adenosine(37)-N6)-threonylcarbamoyltransferase complex dimerization subunit type 1 TsaB [Pirellulales bacterium]